MKNIWISIDAIVEVMLQKTCGVPISSYTDDAIFFHGYVMRGLLYTLYG